MSKESTSSFQKIKVANCIAVGGMIGAGKSTLSKALGQALNAVVGYELDGRDELQSILLKRQYEGDKTCSIAFQIYFFCTRFDKYKKIVKNSSISVADRTIFEDRIFAYQNMLSDPIMFGFYDSMWHDKIRELIYTIGAPKLYVILDVKWDDFKQRLFNRGRQAEIEHFPQNEIYFRELLAVYKDFLVDACQAYEINYLVLDAALPTDQQVDEVLKKNEQIDLMQYENQVTPNGHVYRDVTQN